MIYLNQKEIHDYNTWKEEYTSVDSKHWKKDRSAEALAHFWMENPMKELFFELLNNDDKFKFTDLGDIFIEHKTKFDASKSGPRNHDLCIKKVISTSENYTIGIEAKVDEPFDKTNKKYIEDGNKDISEGVKTNKISRIKEIYSHVTKKKLDCDNIDLSFGKLYYQLFSGLVGTIAEAETMGNKKALFVIHSFITRDYNQSKGRRNYEAFCDFLEFLGVDKVKKNEISKEPYHLHDYKDDVDFEVKYSKNTDVYFAYIETDFIQYYSEKVSKSVFKKIFINDKLQNKLSAFEGKNFSLIDLDNLNEDFPENKNILKKYNNISNTRGIYIFGIKETKQFDLKQFESKVFVKIKNDEMEEISINCLNTPKYNYKKTEKIELRSGSVFYLGKSYNVLTRVRQHINTGYNSETTSCLRLSINSRRQIRENLRLIVINVNDYYADIAIVEKSLRDIIMEKNLLYFGD